MKKIVFSFLLISISFAGIAQGKMERREFVSASLENNPKGEDPLRQLSIYLPQDYEKGTKRYPVIYVLHGYGGMEVQTV